MLPPRAAAFATAGLTLALCHSAVAAPGDNNVGINVHLPPQSYIDAADDLGVTWVRMDAVWWQLEPANGTYRWGPLDAAVTAANTAGLNVFLTLAYTPAWVPRHGDTDGQSGNDVPNSSTEWANFVSAAVTHYRTLGVRHFGLWNEANLQGFFEGTVSEYVNTIVIPGAAAVRAACTDCLVLGPELAHVGAVDQYLAAVLAGAPGVWDIVTHHTYNGFAETGWRIWDGDGFLNALETRRFPFTRGALREVLDDAGYTGEVWITETGYRATPGDAADENLQAIYVRRALEEQLLPSWYTNTFIYEIHDCGPDLPTCTIDGFGLMRATAGTPGSRTYPTDFRRKPAFTGLQQFIINNPAIVNSTPPSECGDGLDNDGDQRIDLDDRGCTGPGDDDESDDPPRLRIEATPAATITIDGDLADFGAVDDVILTDADWRGTEPLGTGDLAVRAAARWDSTAIYLAFVVEDDIHDNDLAPDALWQGDSVQLAFDVGQSGGDGYDALDDHELNFALSGGQAVGFRFHGPAAATDDFEVAVVRVGPTTNYEIRMPRATLPNVVPQIGAVVGFTFLVNDADGSGRVGWSEWTPGIGQSKTPEQFGELALSAAPPNPDAGPSDAPAADAAPEDAGSPQDAAIDDSGVAPDTGNPPDAADVGGRPDAQSATDRGSTEAPAEGDGCACSSRNGQTSQSRSLAGLLLITLAWGIRSRKRAIRR